MITVLTPTYNRAYTLPRLFESLKKQTSRDFEWILIDDGSTDETRTLAESFSAEDCGFSVTYRYKKNGGKHTAVNLGVQLAKGDFSFIVDSDDDLTPDAIETVLVWIKNIDSPMIAAVSGTRGYRNTGKRMTGFPNKFHDTYIDVKNTERYKFGMMGDMAEVYRTAILRKYPFPVFAGENFLPEGTVWNEIAYQGYYVRCYDKIIYWCEYLDDGLTKRSGCQQALDNFEGFTYTISQVIKCEHGIEKIYARGWYFFLAKKKGLTMQAIKQKMHCSAAFLLFCFFILLIRVVVEKMLGKR